MGRLATDVGGTFTDLVYFDEASARLVVTKTLTTPADPSEGVLVAIARSGIAPEAVTFFVHGGTTVINAITERKGARTALVTTAGFRDVLEIGRGNRPDMYNLRYRSPEPFVPRRFRFEVRERLDARGRVVEPLKFADLDPIVELVVEERSAGAPGYSPEAQLEIVTGDHAPTKALSLGRLERIVVEEVAVLVAQIHQRRS